MKVQRRKRGKTFFRIFKFFPPLRAVKLYEPTGVDFTNIIREDFMCSDTISTKNTVKPSVFFALLESEHVKALRKMLVKSDPGPGSPPHLSHNFLELSKSILEKNLFSQFLIFKSILNKTVLYQFL